MRTVDPAVWSKKAKGRQIALARPHRFGRSRRGLEARVRDSFRDAMREFCQNCSFGGIRQAADEETSKGERYRWLVMLTVCLVAGTVTMSLNLARLAEKPPLAISLLSTQHSIQELPFPAIGLCSYNVVSQKILELMSGDIAEKDMNGSYTLEDIRRNLLDLGALVTLALPNVDLQFAYHLQMLYKLKYNVTNLMYKLAPDCKSLLETCNWAGEEKPCDRLFATRITSVGYCCVFNGRYDDVDRNTPPKVLDRVGEDNGLSVIVRENIDDFAYVRKPINGLEVLIFDGTEYPYLEGGAVRVQVAPRNTSVYYTISTRSQLTSRSLKYFSEEWRGCRIGKYTGSVLTRSYSWCLLECRRDAARQLCGCVPYTLQPTNDKACTLNELACLNKHREKFLSFYPFGYTADHPVGEALSEELQDALHCPMCLVDCARPVYSVTPSYVNYQKWNIFRSKFGHGVDLTNVSVLRFFYSTEDQLLYAVENSSEWFELFAYLGSQWFILLGISIITLFEVLYHCSVRWRHHYRRRSRLCAN